jgi:DNA-binding CsgD family transcriptional regulator
MARRGGEPAFERKLAELQAELGVIRTSEASVVSTLAPRLADLLGATSVLVYRHEERGGRVHTPEGSEFGLPGAIAAVDALLASEPPIGSTGYNPLRPDPVDRNRVRQRPQIEARVATEPTVPRVLFRRFGITHDHGARVVVCEGASMLGYVAIFQKAPLEARQLEATRRLIPALRRRLVLDRMWSSAPSGRAMMLAALEAIAAPAWVVRASGVVEHANAAGRGALEVARARTSERLLAAARGVAVEGLATTPVRGRGEADAFLVTERLAVVTSGPEARVGARIRALAAKMELSARLTEVYALVVRGLSNQTIAAELAISQRTVEQHVTALLERAGVESRAALISQLLWARD